MTRYVQQAYDFLSQRKRATYAVAIALLALCMWAFFSTPIRTDVRTMLPEGNNGALTRDFEMLAQSSLANKVFITIQGADNTDRQSLIDAATTITSKLTPPYFIMIDPTSVNPLKAIEFLIRNARNLVHEDDLQSIAIKTNPDNIQANLQADFRQLTSPQGMATKRLIQLDPLGFRSVLAPRLKQLNSFSQATVSDGHLFSQDGTAILLMAQSDIPMTDADGATRLIKQFNNACAVLPENITTDIISGHIHTVANATTIQSDLLTISIIALAALVLLFVVFFRTPQAIGVFLMPLGAMACGLGALALLNQSISAIVIGFGAVLIGISVDFAMHVYFAIARHRGSPGEATRAVAKPILYCGLTSCAAFGALFLSGIPGIRQLALFSIAGLVASLFFSLVILPLLCGGATTRAPQSWSIFKLRRPGLPLIAWGCLIGLSLWFGISTSIDPDLRNIGYRPDSIQQTEERFRTLWGDMRGRAVVFAQSDSLEIALQKNDAVYSATESQFPEIQTASLAPLLPSVKTQTESNGLWDGLWTTETVTGTTSDLRDAGARIGFSARAFLPFEHLLKENPEHIVPDTLDQASLGLIKDMFMPESEAQATLVTYLPDSQEVRAFFSPTKEAELGVHLVSNARFKAALEATMKSDIKQFITVSGSAVLLLSFLLFRNIRRSCLALMPAFTGVIAVFGVLGLTNTDLNLFHITALPLVIGLGADYGIFLVSKETQRFDLSTMTAVTASGLTTLAGFGVLTIARHPSLHSMGITVLTGIGAALLCALFVMPHLLRRES